MTLVVKVKIAENVRELLLIKYICLRVYKMKNIFKLIKRAVKKNEGDHSGTGIRYQV